MKFLLIYTHPSDKSFNHALFTHTRQLLEAAGHDVRVHDLYAMGFDPVLSADELKSPGKDIAALQADVAWADRLFFTYPVWWYNRPAMLQGYIDRVFTHGFAFKSANGQSEGLLKHDRALVFQTAGQTRDDYSGQGDVTIHYAMREGTLGYCGIKNVTVQTYYNVSRAGDAGRQQMLDEAGKLVQEFMQ